MNIRIPKTIPRTISRTLGRKKRGRSGKILMPFNSRPYPSLAALATMGLGLASYFTDRKGRHTGISEKSENKQADYFEAAPRSVTGPHRSFASYSGTTSGMSKRSGSLLLGSAAALTAIYLIGKKK